MKRKQEDTFKRDMILSYDKGLPEDPVDGADGGDGGRVAHSLGQKLLPDLPSKHPCYKFDWSQSNVFPTWAVCLQSDDPLHN